jgi:hypothetical protein
MNIRVHKKDRDSRPEQLKDLRTGANWVVEEHLLRWGYGLTTAYSVRTTAAET